MKSRSLSRMSVYVLGLALLITAGFLAGSTAGTAQPANAQAPRPGLGPEAMNITCPIIYLAVYDNRIQVDCNSLAGPVDFAAPFGTAAESRQTNRLLVLLNTALALSKQPLLWYSDNPGDNPPGCATSNCRLLLGVVLQ